MQYKIGKLSDIKAIKLVVNDTLDQDSRKSLHLKALSLLSTNGYHKLLIDVRNSALAKNYSTMDSIDMASYMQAMVFQKNLKIAFLCTKEAGARKNFVTLTQHSGEINIQHFIDLGAAKAWLTI